MKNTGKKFTASVLAAVICLSAGAMTVTPAFAAETGSAAVVQGANDMPMLRNGIWLSVDQRGNTSYIQINNSISVMKIHSTENNMGISADFDYNRATGAYTVHPGAISCTEYWALTGNDCSTATMTKSDGSACSLFFIGSGDLKQLYSLEQLRGMAQNYFENRHGHSSSVYYVSQIKLNGSGLADVYVMQETSYGIANVVTYTINVKTGCGWDSGDNPIDFTCYA